MCLFGVVLIVELRAYIKRVLTEWNEEQKIKSVCDLNAHYFGTFLRSWTHTRSILHSNEYIGN